jgi:lysozyme
MTAAVKRLSPEGLALIARFEGFVGKPYNDAVGYATVGYGHLIAKRPVTQGDRAKYAHWTETDFRNLLRKDAARFELAVRRAIRVPLTQGQFDALVSLAFNCGEGSLHGDIQRYANSGRLDLVPTVMAKYVNAGGRRLEGLVRRRAEEIRVFRSGRARGTDGLSHLTVRERRMCREYDRLHREGRNIARRRKLRAEMTEQRKRIWRAAQPKPKGDGRGWDHLHRQERYHSLLARTS